MLMVRHLADGGERTAFAYEGDGVVLQNLIHTQSIRTDHRFVCDHHRLVTVAYVVREQSPLAITERAHDQHRLFELDDANHPVLRLEDEAILFTEDGAAPKRCRKFKSTVRLPARPRSQSFFPAQRDRVLGITARWRSQRIDSNSGFCDRQ